MDPGGIADPAGAAGGVVVAQRHVGDRDVAAAGHEQRTARAEAAAAAVLPGSARAPDRLHVGERQVGDGDVAGVDEKAVVGVGAIERHRAARGLAGDVEHVVAARAALQVDRVELLVEREPRRDVEVISIAGACICPADVDQRHVGVESGSGGDVERKGRIVGHAVALRSRRRRNSRMELRRTRRCRGAALRVARSSTKLKLALMKRLQNICQRSGTRAARP